MSKKSEVGTGILPLHSGLKLGTREGQGAGSLVFTRGAPKAVCAAGLSLAQEQLPESTLSEWCPKARALAP